MNIRLIYRNDQTLGVKLERYGPEERTGIRSVAGRKWLQDEKIWTIPYTISAVEQLLESYFDCFFECDELLNKKDPHIAERLEQKNEQECMMPNSEQQDEWVRIVNGSCAMR